MRIARPIRPVLVVFLAMIALLLGSLSQVMFARVLTNARPESRVTKQIDNSKRTTLYGHVPSAVRTATDLGRQEPRTPSPGMIMVLKSSEEQKKELRKVIDEQQDQRTANYHQWLTPEQFGEHFGVHDDDIAAVKSWLTSQGFTVDEVSKSKRVIKFSGNIGQVEHAFQTEMHLYTYEGEMHVSNSREISVPEALNKVIAGVTLHNFYRRGSFERKARIKHGPKYTSSSTVHYVGPADFATIYNTAPLLAAGINGTGSSIAVVGRSDILMSDVQTYRQLFNLPPNDPIFVHAGQDNGIEPGDDGESDLDVEISGGMAPNAQVYFVIGTPTFLVDGITNSIQYIVENNLADIMSISYGSCEAVEGVGGNEYNNQAFEQAAAQGISVFVASGDAGPAGCDNQGSQTYEVLGYAVGAEAATPYSVAVGGTEFYGDSGAGPTYWSATNNALYQNSALSYIPEYPWNASRVASPVPAGISLSDLWSGSGGISAYYLRPSWQTGSGINNAADPALTLGNGATGLWVTSVTLTNGGGSGYTTAPSITFTGGGCTAEPAATTTISGGSVNAIVFTGYSSHFQGFGCTSAPTVAFGAAPGGGTTATGTANVGQMQNPAPLIAGVPHRMLPDLSLNASSGPDGTLFCSEGVCEVNSSGQFTNAGIVGGTSVAAPSMAGIQALINQANGGRQGMPGYIYYAIANSAYTANPATCNSSTPPAASCAFNDITLGNTLICGLSGGSCTAALTSAKIGFLSGVGYDMATGLGSVNAFNLANQWKNVAFNATTTTLNLSQTTFAHGTPITLSGTVSGSGTPTGDVAFIVSQGEIGVPVNPNTGAFAGAGAFTTLSGGSYSDSLSNLPAGTYNVQARYAGDNTFASSLSAPVPLTVSGGEATTVTITPGSINQSTCILTNTTSFTYGGLMWTTINVTGASGQGVPTGTVTISVNGNSNYTTVRLDPQGNGYLAAGAVPSSSCLYDYIFAQAPTLAGGTYNIGASYSGDGTFAAGSATPVSVTVSPLSITPTLAAGGTLITAGTADQLTASFGTIAALTGSGKQSSGPTGTVTFTDTTTSTVLGTGTVVPTISFSANIYTYSATAVLNTTGITTSGANSITASYSGDSNYAATVSGAATVTVGTGTATTTTVTSNGNPTTLNGRPTFTATITGAPTAGTVTFYDGTTVLGTGTVGAAHTATFRPASGAAFFGGAHSITAAFGGNSTFMASTSPVFTETVTPGTNTINLSAKTVGTSGQAYTFAAVLTPSQTNATYAPNQSVVNFFDGATNIGSGQPQTFTSGQGGYGLWTATTSTITLTPGTHTITATYTDINYSLGTSNAQTVYVGNTTVGIYSPLGATTLPNPALGGNTTFRWYPDGASAVAHYWLDIGSTQGGNQYYQSGDLGSVLSKAVANNLFPSNGSTVWARLWYLVNGTWNFADSSYVAYGAGTAGVITSPAPPGPLTGSSVVFNWSAGTGATAYWIDAGTSAGGGQYFSSGNIGNVLTDTVTNLPTDGSTVYITLFSLVGGNWLNNAYTYTAYSVTGSPAVMQTPIPGSTLTSANVTFTWAAGAGASAYWMDAGSTPGGNQYYQSGNLGGALTTMVNGLPTDGSTIYVTLYSLIGANWVGNAYTYTALSATGGLAVMQTPIPGSTLSGNTVTFTWSADANATAYWVDISNIGPGGNDLDQSGNLGNVLTETVYNLPADGSTIYVTLYSYVGGQWLSTASTYTSGP